MGTPTTPTAPSDEMSTAAETSPVAAPATIPPRPMTSAEVLSAADKTFLKTVVVALIIMIGGVGAGAFVAITPAPADGPATGDEGTCVADCEVQLTLGVLLDQTGLLADIGKQMVDAAKMAADDVNSWDTGKVDDEDKKITGIKLSGNRTGKFRLVVEDSQTDSGFAKQKADKLVNIDHAPVIIGSIGSSITLAAATVTRPAKVLLFSPASTSPRLSLDDWIFRTVGSDAIQGLAMLDLVKALKEAGKVGSKIGIFSINNAYGYGVADTLRAHEAEFGLSHIYWNLYEEGKDDYSPELKALAEARAKLAPGEKIAVLLTTYPDQGLRMFKSILKLDMFYESGYQWVTNDGIAWSPVLEDNPDAWAGMRGLYGTDPSTPKSDQRYSDFVKGYSANFSQYRHPSSFAAFTYDAVLATASAAQRMGEYTGEKVREGLLTYSKSDPFLGVTGAKWWDKNGDTTQQYYEIYHVKAGRKYFCDNGGWWLGTPDVLTSPPGTIKDFVPDQCLSRLGNDGHPFSYPPPAVADRSGEEPASRPAIAAVWRDE